MTDKTMPALRFRGFYDAWEQRKLGKLATFSKGSGYTKSDLVNFGNPIILYGRLYTKYETVIRHIDTFVLEKENSVISRKNEVIVPASGESSEDISRASVVDKSGIILGGDLNIIQPLNFIDSIFLALTISNGSQKKEMAKRAQGKSIVHLHNSDLRKVNLVFPKLLEQQKIGSFFKQLDFLITQNGRKSDLLKRQKQAYLQKIFSQKLRFAGFSGGWEQRKVKEMFKVTRGQVLAATETSKVQSDISPFPVYSSQTKNNGLMGYYKDYLFDTAITWTTDGANAGTVSYREGRFYSTNVNGVLISDKGYTNKAISEILNLEAWKWVSHVGNPKLMNNVMGDISIVIPKSFVEQDRLSEFFKQLDHLIALHQQKLNLLKKQKQAFLQKMFI
jgi:type I restriction enzyme S subunit